MSKADGRAVELILDASRSMTGQPIKDAKEVLKRVIAEDLPEGIPVAVRVYGMTKGCSTELVQPLTPLTTRVREELQRKIAGIQTEGNTNIAGSLAAVKDDLAGATGDRHVVLVTDGDHNCKQYGTVEAELEKLKKAGFDVRVDIVGFVPQDSPLHEKFEQWAKVTGGAYLKAHDSDKLIEALKEALEDDRSAWEILKDAAKDFGEGAKDLARGDFGKAGDDFEKGLDDLGDAFRSSKG